ncbi:MAG: sigma-70 family RNA polymerase sigma factor [Leucobacter sp.]
MQIKNGGAQLKNIELTEASDMTLVEVTRSGMMDAYAELWKRHSPAVLAAIRSFTGFDPDDVAQETFLRVLQQIRSGRGPETAFRAYAIMTARNISTNMARSRSSDETTGNDDSVFEMHTLEQPDMAETVLGNSFTQQVYSSLPTRWQEVLWYRDVEDLPVRELCTYLGMSENATSALLKRAREGFKLAWIAANLEPATGLSQDCKWVVERLPQLTRGKVSAATRKKLESHFETCTRCAILAEESDRLHSRLALVLLPGLLGGAGAVGYTAWLQSEAITSVSAAAATVEADHTSVANFHSGLDALSKSKAAVVPIAVASVGLLIAAIAFSTGDTQPSVASPAPTDDVVVQVDPESQEVTEEDSVDDSPGTTSQQEQEDNAQIDAGAPQEDNQVSADSGNAVETAPGTDAPAVLPVALSASPADGVEVGVFPRLVGVGTPNASVTLTIQNERGENYAHTLTADAQGRWAYTPNALMGQVRVSGTQAYSYQGKEYVDDVVLIGVYEVGRGLSIDVQQINAQQTRIRLTGLDTPTKNQVVNVESTALGTLASNQSATSPGEVLFTVPYPRAALGDLRFWQGNTSEGPRRVWWRILGD